MTLTELRQQKKELIGWFKFTKDKTIRKEIRKLDNEIKKYLKTQEAN
jgi:hypothetical protein